jgi:hypothetical protein
MQGSIRCLKPHDGDTGDAGSTPAISTQPPVDGWRDDAIVFRGSSPRSIVDDAPVYGTGYGGSIPLVGAWFSPASSKEEHCSYKAGTRDRYLRWVRKGNEMKILIFWVLVIAFAVWSFSEKTAPLHKFVASNSLASVIAAVVISVIMLVFMHRENNRVLRRRGQK